MRLEPSPLAALVVVAALLAALPAGARSPSPRTPDEQREALIGLLGATELRLGRALLDTVGDDVPHQLILVADLPAVAPIVRTRAVAALAYYPSPQTRGYLVSLLHERSLANTAVGALLRRQAIRSLGAGFGEGAIDDLIPLQGDRDPLIREAVARGLGDTASAHALPTLEAWLGREPELTVRAAIDHAISQLRGR